MYYELNVALNGKHFFATAPRSITDQHTASAMFVLFREKFPEVDGYTITCTRWETAGYKMELTDLF